MFDRYGQKSACVALRTTILFCRVAPTKAAAVARDLFTVDRADQGTDPFRADADGIERKKDKIANSRFNYKGDYLREKHDCSAECAAIKQKSCSCTKERGCAKPAAVHLIKENDKRNSRNHAKNQVLEKDHDAKCPTLPRSPTWS